MAAATIIAANYVATARVLWASFQLFNPGRQFTTLIIDGIEADRSLTGLGRIVLPEDLEWDGTEWFEMAAQYDVMELATAAKPALLRHLLRSAPTATYLDPDIQVFAALDDVFRLTAEHGIALTPHCLHPLPRDGLDVTERMIMLAGIFNLGFISVSRGARPFLRWWQQRLRTDAIVDPANALFTDQRWVDWVPALFGHVVLRDPGLNVAYWNVHERDLHRTTDGRILAGASPLRFFHFSGYQVERPTQLSKHGGPHPRVRLSDYPLVEDLCAGYAEQLASHEDSIHKSRPFRLTTLDNGFRLTQAVRRLVRRELGAGHRFGRDGVPGTLPNPFTDADAFVQWLTKPVTGTADARIARWELAVWLERGDLRQVFPDLIADDAIRFRFWLHHDLDTIAERRQYEDRSPRRSAVRDSSGTRAAGWSVIAYADAELGVGEAGRRLARAVQQVGLPTEVVGAGSTESRHQQRHCLDLRATPSFDNSITCVNADQLARTWRRVGMPAGRPDQADGRRIGLWFWEVDEIPEQWRPAFGLLDEIWVASRYTQSVFDRVGLCPVELVTLPVTAPAGPTGYTRAMLGMPDDAFVFLCVYDFLSVLRRKNPLDLVDAYLAAFGPEDGATLVLKSINGHLRPEQLAMVQRAARRRRDIVVVDGYRSSGQVRAMIELADCLVSLHRSEGYGLNLIDAMALGTPVIATGFSGNMTFMDEQAAFLVPFSEIAVGSGAHPYPAHARWAQPDLVAAAAVLREVFDDQPAARLRGGVGQALVTREHSLAVAGARVRELLLDRG